MKILLLGDIASAHLQKWAISLSKNGIKIAIFSFNHTKDKWWKNETGIRILHHASEKKSPRSFFTKISYLFLLGKLKQAIQSFQPDILHAHYASSYGLIGRLSGFHPLVISVWGTDVMKFPLHNFITKNILINNIKQADLICVTSNVLKKHCLKYSQKTSVIIPFGIDFSKFNRHEKITKHEFVIGCVKSLETVYRIDLLIDAFSKIQKTHKNTSLKLLIVGGGSLEHELKAKVNELGINHVVEFTGKVPHEDVPKYYQKMDVFCNLSTYESFGVSIIEAMACGAVVISTKTEGAEEIISNENIGLLIEIGNLDQLVEKMNELIKNSQLRNQLSEAALKYVQEKYDWNNNVFEMINQYKLLISAQ